ncbi:MAG: thermonuclease family protein [Desulfobacterota bacterium]|nr:thermonuclease family protein [Thermodesulfobacteriota bacterium]MDW8001996.1 thermonuclease family protein [Deltaproteobacteria bacterium]
MKRFVLFILLFLFTSHSGFSKEYLVTKIIDGDTIQIENGVIVRYIGVDAPELRTKEGISEFYAKQAAHYNKKLVFLKKVRLEYDVEKEDSHGRTLAYVYVKNTFVNAELIRLGYARAIVKPPNVKYKDLFLSLQQKAMAEQKGLWQESKPDTETFYVGNKRSYVFHRPKCTKADKISEMNKIIFRSRFDAIRIGYSPCRQCRP